VNHNLTLIVMSSLAHQAVDEIRFRHWSMVLSDWCIPSRTLQLLWAARATYIMRQCTTTINEDVNMLHQQLNFTATNQQLRLNTYIHVGIRSYVSVMRRYTSTFNIIRHLCSPLTLWCLSATAWL